MRKEISQQEREKRDAIITLTQLFREYNLWVIVSNTDFRKMFDENLIKDFDELHGIFYAENVPNANEVTEIFDKFVGKYNRQVAFIRDWIDAYYPKYDC